VQLLPHVPDRRVRIRLRTGITFHDGSPLDAGAVQASFERIARLGVSPLAGDLRNLGVISGHNGTSVTFDLPEPNFEFVRLVLANPYAAIVSPRASEFVAPGLVACTGPYRYVPELYDPDSSITLRRWSDYRWPKAYFETSGAAAIPQLSFVFVADRDERYARLVEGSGCVLSLSKEHVADLAKRSRFRRLEATGGVTYLGFNFQRTRWQDLRLRQAVALALDRDELAAMGPFQASDTPLPPTAIGYDARSAEYGYGHDRDRSRSLLHEAGFNPDQEVVLLIPESNTYSELAAAVRRQLAAVGIDRVRIRSVPRSEILSARQDFDLLLFDYAWGDYTALGIFLGPGTRNLLGYPDDDVAMLVREALATADPIARHDAVLEAQRVVLENALWQPLLVRRITFAVDGDCVEGETQSPWGELLFHDAVTH
jgi:peptide/nickel transport system substrate-binding protein